VTWEGERVPYRLLYSSWVTEWVRRLDPKASDELIILARGRLRAEGGSVCRGLYVSHHPGDRYVADNSADSGTGAAWLEHAVTSDVH
jgi:hypothetical protein